MADLERAKVLIELRRLSEAREQLAAVLAAEPDNAEAATYLAQAAYLDQRYHEAAAQSAAALRIQPRNQFAMRIHALALLNTDTAGRWEAQRVARRVVALGPEFAENHRIQAIVLRECGNLPAALEAIDRAVELDPDEADIHVARGSILRRMGLCGNRFRSGPAAEAYHTALRLEPENAYAVHDLAIVELNGRRLRNALRGVLNAASMDPALGDLVRTNAATVIRHAVRRMHWVLTAIAFVTLVLGTHEVAVDAPASAPIHAAAVAGSRDYFVPQLVPISRASEPPGTHPAGGTSGPVTSVTQDPPASATQPPGPSAAQVPAAGTTPGDGAPASASAPPSTPVKVSGEVRAPAMVPVPPNPALGADTDSSVKTHDSAHLGTLGRDFGAIGLTAIVVVSLWWLGVIPRRRRRFVLSAAWANPPTALRLVVFGVGMIVCVVGVASGLRIFLSVGEPALLALGIILRRIA